MRKSALLLLAFAAGSMGVAIAGNDIEPTKEYYSATKIPKAITLNGDMADWAGVPVLSDPKFAVPKGSGTGANPKYVLFEEYAGGTWTGPDDQTSAVQVAWDADNLYLGVVVTDDYHENSANSAWNGDSIQLMIANGDRNQQIALYNYALGGVEDNLGEVIVMHEAGPGGTEAMVTRDGVKKKTFYEIKMPAASVGQTALSAGMKFGFGMAINDGDKDTPGQKGWGGLGAHALVFGKSPSETALVTLSTNEPGKDRFFYSAINPTPELFSFRVNDKGTSILDPATVKLTLDGSLVTLTASPKAGEASDFSYTPAKMLASGVKHTYAIEAKDTLGNIVADSGSFTPIYTTLPAAFKETAVDTSKRGFIWKVFQNEASQANSNWRAEQEIAGVMAMADGTAMPNLADAAAIGPALAEGTPANPGSDPIKFEIDTVVNLSQIAGENNGAFTPDEQMPGIPGSTGMNDGIAAEITTYVELPKGWVTLGVNSDDGFATYAGPAPDKFLGLTLGEFDAGRGATDTTFKFWVEEAGIYKIRTIYEEGGGGANIELFSLKADGTKALLNDTASGGLKCYRAKTGAAANPAVVSYVEPAIGLAKANPNKVQAVIWDGSAAVDKATVSLKIDGTAASATITKAGKATTVTYVPSPIFAANSKHTATVAYTDAGTVVTRSWDFTVGPFTLDKTHGYLGVVKGSAVFSADAGGRSGKAGDYAMDLTKAGGPVQVTDPAFMTAVNAATANDELSVVAWIKKYDIADSSAIWFSSPTQGRVFQAHTPWSNNNIYFDTAGCCGGDTRINAGIDTFADYTGDTGWWTNWHHFVFTKKADAKQVWIDGKLFLEGSNTGTLSTDVNQFMIGSDNGGGGLMHGIVDDVAVFSTALAEADVLALSKQTLPSALAAAKGLLGYWDFNDAPKPVTTAPALSVAKDAQGKVVITFEGGLQSSDAVTGGTWTDVTGSSPLTVTPSGIKFYRAKR